MLDLSTGHLPEHVCTRLNDYDGVTAHKTGYGWLLVVPSDLAEHHHEYPDTVPEAVWQLWEYAHRFGAEYLLLHPDANHVDALPSWVW